MGVGPCYHKSERQTKQCHRRSLPIQSSGLQMPQRESIMFTSGFRPLWQSPWHLAPPTQLQGFLTCLRGAGRGSSAGPSGMTDEHLRILLDDEEDTRLVRCVLSERPSCSMYAALHNHGSFAGLDVRRRGARHPGTQLSFSLAKVAFGRLELWSFMRTSWFGSQSELCPPQARKIANRAALLEL